MKKTICLSLLAMLAPVMASAQTVDGPFANTAAVEAFWNGPSAPTQNAFIYVNGYFLLDHSGFNPILVQQYFQCFSPSVIKTHCGNIKDGDGQLSYIVALFPAGDEITLNGNLYRAAAPGNTNSADILVCSTDDNLAQYYKVGSYSTGFGPPFASTCY